MIERTDRWDVSVSAENPRSIGKEGLMPHVYLIPFSQGSTFPLAGGRTSQPKKEVGAISLAYKPSFIYGNVLL